MKIAYIISMVNGMEPFIHREIKELQKKGLDIVLFITKYRKDPIFGPEKEWEYYYVRWNRILFYFFLSLIRYFIKLPHLFKIAFQKSALVDFGVALYFSPIMDKIKVEKIHCHFGDHKLFIGYFCSKILNLPLSVTIHAHELYANPNPKMFEFAIKQCDKIITIAEKNKDILVNEYGVDVELIEVIRLFADPIFFKEKEKIRVLTVGRFTPRKGFDDLFKAIKLLNRDDVEFIVVGFGPLDVKGMARALGVEDKVTFFGRLDPRQLRVLYHSCHIYCLPSKTIEGEGKEGIPVVLMEAMASEMAVVATRNGAVDEIVKYILVDENDPQQLANAINYYLNNRELIKQHGLMNKEIIKEYYSIKNLDQLYFLHNEIFIKENEQEDG
jgi:glycosyltransferase involved in cell wall biosynthesis